jgi:sialic acid synthase SpsE
LRQIGAELFKVASPELNHCRLLDEIASYNVPVILSSGVSKLGDIERAVSRLRPLRDSTGQNTANAGHSPKVHDLALLHCVTAYPAPAEDYNLRILPHLSGIYGLPVGVSDHSLDPVLVPALSVALGAVIVEKHICLSRKDSGLDDPIALPPDDFSRMTAALRRAQTQSPETTIVETAESFGAERVAAVLGDGVKRLALSEERNYGRTNRTIHACVDIEKGTRFSKNNIAVLRTEKVLRPGLDPELFDVLIGRKAERDIPAGEGIEWADVGGLS